MRISELGGMSISANVRGARSDREHSEQLKRREKARKDSQDIKDFTETMMEIYPEYFGDAK